MQASKKPKNGELPLISAVTGYSLIYVKQVSCGQRHNPKIEWAKARLQELKTQLKEEYEQKFGPDASRHRSIGPLSSNND